MRIGLTEIVVIIIIAMIFIDKKKAKQIYKFVYTQASTFRTAANEIIKEVKEEVDTVKEPIDNLKEPFDELKDTINKAEDK